MKASLSKYIHFSSYHISSFHEIHCAASYDGRMAPVSSSVSSLLFSTLCIMGCLMICSRLVNTRARLRNLLGSVSISVGQEWVSSGLR